MPIALPALGAFAVALLALIVALAAVLLGEVLKQVFNVTIPVIGNLGTLARSAVRWAVARLAAMLTSSMGGLGFVFHYLWHTHSAAITRSQTFAQHAVNRVHGVVHHTIPAQVNGAATVLNEAIYASAVHEQQLLGTTAHNLQVNMNTDAATAHAELATTAHNLQVNMNTDAATAHAELATTAHNLQANIDALAHSTSAAIAAADQLTAHDVAQLRGELLTDLEAVERYAAQVGQSVAAYAGDAAAAAERNAEAWANEQARAVAVALWPTVATPARRAQQGVAAEAPGVLSGVPAISDVAPASMAAVLAQTLAMAATATAYVDECGLSLCSGLRTLATLLNGLEETGLVAALLALAAAAVTDPLGVARVVETVAEAPVYAAEAVARAAVGL